MATFNRDAVDLSNVAVGGMIREDVMDQIYRIDPEETPFHDMAGRESASATYKEFTQEDLDSIDLANARVDGADAGADSGATERRLGTYHQISDKVVKQSHRAQEVNSIASVGKLLRRVMLKQKALRRDCEAIAVSNQAAQPGDGDEGNAGTTGEGKTAGAPTWIITNTSSGAAPGAAPQYSDSANKAGYPSVAAVPGVIRALSEAVVKSMIEATYLAGGDVSIMMSTPSVISKYSEFHFGSDAKVATLQSDKAQAGPGELTAYKSVNVVATNFGITLELVPNRQQQLYNTGTAADVFLFDPEYWFISYLQGFRTEPLAKTGTADNRQITVDWAVGCTAEKANACIRDIDPTAAVTA